MTDEQIAAFDRDGFLVVEDVLEGDQLERVQEAFHRVEEETREEGRRKALSRTS